MYCSPQSDSVSSLWSPGETQQNRKSVSQSQESETDYPTASTTWSCVAASRLLVENLHRAGIPEPVSG